MFDPSRSDTNPSIPFFPLVTVALRARVVPVPFVVKEEGSCGVDGELTMGLKIGWEDGGSSSPTVGAGSPAERKSYVDPITGVEILRWEMFDWVGKTSFRFVVVSSSLGFKITIKPAGGPSRISDTVVSKLGIIKDCDVPKWFAVRKLTGLATFAKKTDHQG